MHTRTLVLNLHKTVLSVLQNPSVVSDDPDTIALQNILKICEEASENIQNRSYNGKTEESFAVTVLTTARDFAVSTSTGPFSRALHTIHSIADAALSALEPKRQNEYMDLVIREILSATEAKKDDYPLEREIYQIAARLCDSRQNGNRIEAENFIGAFRDAIARIEKKSGLGLKTDVSGKDQIINLIHREVSGAFAFLELRTTGLNALNDLIQVGEKLLRAQDILPRDRTVAERAVKTFGALRGRILAVTTTTPQNAIALGREFSETLSRQLSHFDELGNYYPHTAESTGDDASALVQMRSFHQKIERVAATLFPSTSNQIGISFARLADEQLQKHSLYQSLLPRIRGFAEKIPTATVSGAEIIDEIGNKENAQTWKNEASLLLLLIGIARRTTGEKNHPLAQAAETTFEKLLTRRVLFEGLVTAPTVFVSSSKEEGTSDLSLYRIAASYYRNASMHRQKLLASACNTIVVTALNFLEEAKSCQTEDEGSPFSSLREAAITAQKTFSQNKSDAKTPAELISFASSLLLSCREAIENSEKPTDESRAYQAAISYLINLLNDLNARLLRRELYRTYRDTASVIVSGLSRAEYSRTTVEQIHTIAEEILLAADNTSLSFSGHLLRKFCSENLREIAGRTGVDVIRKVSDYAEDCCDTLLNAKAIWELRRSTITQLRTLLKEGADAASCYTTARRLDRRAFMHLCHLAENPQARKKALEDRKQLIALLDELLPSFLNKNFSNPAENDNGKKKTKRLRALAALNASDSGKSFLNAAAELSQSAKQNPEALEQALEDFSAILLPIIRIADECLDEKKRIADIKKALTEEEHALMAAAKNSTLSSRKIHDSFTAYLRTSIKANTDLRNRTTPLGKIYHVWINADSRIEDDPSSYLRLYTEASISLIASKAELILPGDTYTGLVTPLSAFLTNISQQMCDPLVCPTKESLLHLSTYAFRVIEAHYEICEIASSTASAIKLYSGRTADSLSPSDCGKLNHIFTDVRKQVAHCRESVAKCRPAVRQTKNASDTSSAVALDPVRDLLDQLNTLLQSAGNYSDKNIDEAAFREILSLLNETSTLTAPYLQITEKTETIAFRAEISKIRRQIKEVADASETTRSRAMCASALSAIAQLSRSVNDREVVAEIADRGVTEITELPGGESNSLRIYETAISALLEIGTQSENKTVREKLSETILDLSERKEIRAFLVDTPIGELTKAFRDPTDDQIYSKAKELYTDLSNTGKGFYSDILTNLLRDALTQLSTFTKPNSFDKISSVAEALMQSANRFEDELRSLIKPSGEQFVPTATRIRADQLRDLLYRLFDFAKAAATANRDDDGKQALANDIMLIATEGIMKFNSALSGKSHGAIDSIPEVCRTVSQQTRNALKNTEISDTLLLGISRRAKALRDKVTLPSLLEHASRNAAEQSAAIEFLMTIAREELEHMTADIGSFIEEHKGSALPGKTAINRSSQLIKSILNLLQSFDQRKKDLLFGKLLTTSANVPLAFAACAGKISEGSMVAIYDIKGRPSGQNTALPREKRTTDQGFLPVTEGKEETYYRHGLSVAKTILTEDQCVILGDRRYLAKSHAHSAGGREYYLITFTEVEATLRLKRTAEDDNTVVALITLDNLEELAHYVRIDYRDAKANVESALREFAGSIHGIFHEQERDKYILFFSQKEMASLVNNKFSDLMNRLEEIKLGDSSVSVTISIGISALGETLTVKEQNASLALDTALRRGGAQVAIYRDDDTPEGRYEFFSGNQQKGLQNESRINARVVADYLCELIRKAGDVLIMGHAFPDFDSIGSCVGIAALARYYKKDVHIVTNTRTQNFIDCTPDLLKLPEYQNVFIDATTGMELKGTNTLLILCDVSNVNIMESQDLARTSFNTVIIDHHIKAAVSDDLRTALTYVDPSASSASELVSEILSESLPKNELKKEEANVLLSGIMVDTKNFTKSVGARTFAAALYLRQMGANAEISNTYFFEESSDYKAEVVFRKNLTFHPTIRKVAITFCSEDDLLEDADIARCNLRVAASKAADKLLTVRGVQASFSLYPFKMGNQPGVSISGRSDGTINVQQILEAFKGGGHFDSAGAAVKNTTVEATTKALIEVISNHFAAQSE